MEIRKKPIYREELPKKGVWTFCRFKGAWQRRGKWHF